MAAADKYAMRRAPQWVFRRRRAALGIGFALMAIAATGVGFAGAADPSLEDRINSARSAAGEVAGRGGAQSQRIVSLIEQARQAGARAMELNAQVQRAETRSLELASELD